MSYFLSVVGMVLVVEGLPYFWSPAGVKRVAAKVMEVSDTSLRTFGLILMVLGVAVVYLSNEF